MSLNNASHRQIDWVAALAPSNAYMVWSIIPHTGLIETEFLIYTKIKSNALQRIDSNSPDHGNLSDKTIQLKLLASVQIIILKRFGS